MKKETLVTAIVFLGVGFLAGFAFNAHRNSVLRQKAAAVITPLAGSQASASDPAQSTSAPSNDQSSPNGADGAENDLGSQLPKGHPPLTDAEVIQFFKDASAHNPNDPSPRLKLADFLYDRRRFEEAIPWFQQTLTLDPKNADARTDMATCYFNLGQVQEAIRALHEVLKTDPRHEPTLFNLAVVNMEGTHNFAAARKAWERLHAINPNYPGLDQLKQALEADNRGSSTSPRSTLR